MVLRRTHQRDSRLNPASKPCKGDKLYLCRMSQTNSSSLKWGILGLGKIAHKMAQDLALSDSSKLQAVASRSATKAKYFASTYQVSIALDSYQALCEQPDLDIIYIATPHAFHYEHSMMALKAGKSVLCEKPMGMSAQEVQSLSNYAQEQGLFLMEGLWTRFMPATQKVLDLIQSGSIGEIESLEADFSFKANYDPQGRLFNPNLGGGALLDIGIYPLYLSLLLLGKADELKLKAQIGETGVDEACDMELAYTNGSKAYLSSSFLEDGSVEATIRGSKGKITMHRRFHHCERISVKTKDESYALDIPIRGLGYFHEIQEVEHCLAEGQSQSKLHSLENSLQLAQELDRALALIKAGSH